MKFFDIFILPAVWRWLNPPIVGEDTVRNCYTHIELATFNRLKDVSHLERLLFRTFPDDSEREKVAKHLSRYRTNEAYISERQMAELERIDEDVLKMEALTHMSDPGHWKICLEHNTFNVGIYQMCDDCHCIFNGDYGQSMCPKCQSPDTTPAFRSLDLTSSRDMKKLVKSIEGGVIAGLDPDEPGEERTASSIRAQTANDRF